MILNPRIHYSLKLHVHVELRQNGSEIYSNIIFSVNTRICKSICGKVNDVEDAV